VQRAQLFVDEKPQDDDRAAGIQEILPSLPQAHPAQRSEVDLVIEQRGRSVMENGATPISIDRMPALRNYEMETGA
jgi:hypothetical protein